MTVIGVLVAAEVMEPHSYFLLYLTWLAIMWASFLLRINSSTCPPHAGGSQYERKQARRATVITLFVVALSPGAIACACRDFEALQMAAPPFRVIVHFGVISFGGHSPDASHTMIGPELNFAFRLEKVAARLDLPWIFFDTAAARLQEHLSLVNCGAQKVPDFAPERACFTLKAKVK
jgi:hypothetical protein